jgi:FkbM family methyltransferase
MESTISFVCNGSTIRKSITMNNFVNLINKYIDSSHIRTIVDAGSMDGMDAFFFKSNFPHTTTYAIEGLPENCTKYLSILDNIVPINAVISSYDGTITYYQKNINGIHGIYNRGNEYGTTQLQLNCYKLSTIMKKYSITEIDVIKIDVEGATLDLLQSLEDNLKNIKIMHIETETYPFFSGQKLHEDVCNFLIDNNFVLIDITFVEIIPNKYQSDSVWVNKQFIK